MFQLLKNVVEDVDQQRRELESLGLYGDGKSASAGASFVGGEGWLEG